MKPDAECFLGAVGDPLGPTITEGDRSDVWMWSWEVNWMNTRQQG